MKKGIIIALAVVLAAALLLTLAFCNKKQPAQSWQSQFDLGVRYLENGNYQEAILAFQAAIQIDPKQKDAYLGLADAYIAIDEEEKAIDTLFDALEELGDDPEIIARLEALGFSFDDNSTTPDGKIRMEIDDEHYALVLEDEKGHLVLQEIYTMDGVMQRYFVSEWDENGIERVRTEHAPDGTVLTVTNRRADGSHEKTVQYDPDGSYLISHTSEDALEVKEEYYGGDGALRYYVIRRFDKDGNLVSAVSYNPDGSVRD